MRVNIGPFKSWVGPYQIAGALMWLVAWDKDKETRERRAHKLGDWLCDHTKLDEICSWIDSKRKRKIEVQVEDWDYWNADSTLSILIVPVLQKLRDNLQGHPSMLDPADAPVDLEPEGEDSIDFARWKWILDEMIWAFDYTNRRQDCGIACTPDERELQERCKRGRLLFAKYYDCLWD